MMDGIGEWRAPVKRGKKTYDDKDFIESLRTQFARRKNLSQRQTLALRRVVSAYKERIPSYAERAAALGLPPLDAPEAAPEKNA